MNFVDNITRYAMHLPDKAAIVDGDRAISYTEMYSMVAEAEGRLLAEGLAEGDRVGLTLRDDVSHLVLYLAAARLGIATMPLHWRSSVDEIDRSAAETGLRLLVTDVAHKSPIAVPALSFERRWLDTTAAAPNWSRAPAQDGDLMFTIAHSSGTTGRPVPAYLTHRMIASVNIRNVLNCGQPANRRYLNVTPLSFISSRNYCLYHFLGGSTVVLRPPWFSTDELVEMVRDLEINSLFLVPTTIRALLDLPPQAGVLFPDLDILTISAAETSAAEKRLIVDRITPNIVELYGTSVVGCISALQGFEIQTKADSVGRPAMASDVEIVGAAGQTLAPGETGLIRCLAPRDPPNPNVERDTPTGQPQPPEGWAWYYPGEVGYFDAEGYLYLKGRVSDIIIRGGVNIYPAEIEDVLRRHPAVREAAVVGKPDRALGEIVVAFVVGNDTVDATELRHFCRERLVADKVPAEIILVVDLPKTSVGKIRKRELAKRWDGRTNE